jgi:hypothetical protein
MERKDNLGMYDDVDFDAEDHEDKYGFDSEKGTE